MDLTVPLSPGKPGSREQELAQRVVREFGIVQSNRGVWESHWQEIAERIWPGMSWKFNPYWYSTPGAKKNQFVFDSTASLALGRFGAILDSLLTPRSGKWHKLKAIDDTLNKRRDVRDWCEKATNILFHYRYLGQANFASQMQQVYKSLGALGSGAMFVDPLLGRNQKGLRYKTIGLGEIYFVENHQGIVDKCFRYFDLTVRQAIQKWGDKLPENILKLKDSNPEQVFHFIHLVEPREDYDPERRDFKGMPFASYYVSKEENTLLEEGGYHVFPYAVSRYDQFPGEVYGRSIAMDLLPAIKTLNEEKKTMLKQGHRIVDPIYLFHDDGIMDYFSAKPGSAVAGGVTADGRPLVHTLPTGNIAAGKDLMDDERNIIKDGFLVSIFQILQENPQMTATEVLERAKEKGILLTPTVGRQQSELHTPMIERELDVLAMQGLLPPMPDVLKQSGGFKVVFDSPLNRAQRAEEASGLYRTLEQAINVATVTNDPTPLFYFNFDTIIPEIADINAVPFHWINSPEQVAAKKAALDQQKQTQSLSEIAPGAAAVMGGIAKLQKAKAG